MGTTKRNPIHNTHPRACGEVRRAGINTIKDMIRKVGWVPQKGILYVTPTLEHAERCAGAFLGYDFSQVVSKVSQFPG